MFFKLRVSLMMKEESRVKGKKLRGGVEENNFLSHYKKKVEERFRKKFQEESCMV